MIPSKEWRMSQSWKVVLVALPCLLAPMGCVPNKAIKYNNDVADVTIELEAAGKYFGERLQPNLGNPAKVNELYAETAKKADRIIKRGKGLTPPNTTEGK